MLLYLILESISALNLEECVSSYDNQNLEKQMSKYKNMLCLLFWIVAIYCRDYKVQ